MPPSLTFWLEPISGDMKVISVLRSIWTTDAVSVNRTTSQLRRLIPTAFNQVPGWRWTCSSWTHKQFRARHWLTFTDWIKLRTPVEAGASWRGGLEEGWTPAKFSTPVCFKFYRESIKPHRFLATSIVFAIKMHKTLYFLLENSKKKLCTPSQTPVGTPSPATRPLLFSVNSQSG